MTRLGLNQQGISVHLSEASHLLPDTIICRSFLLKELYSNARLPGHFDLPLHQKWVQLWLQYVEGQINCGTSSIGDLCVLIKVCPWHIYVCRQCPANLLNMHQYDTTV